MGDGFCGTVAVHIGFYQCHAVLGQRSGFIGTDHRSSPKGFHSRKTADDGIFMNHSLNPDGKYDGDDGR